MSEEIQNAANIVPRSIVLSYFYNGLLGFGMLLALLFARGDLSTLENPPSGYAFIEIYYQATHSTAGTAVMVSFVLIMQFCATVSVQTSASRMLWSFSRDRGVPGWKLLRKVKHHLLSPNFRSSDLPTRSFLATPKIHSPRLVYSSHKCSDMPTFIHQSRLLHRA